MRNGPEDRGGLGGTAAAHRIVGWLRRSVGARRAGEPDRAAVRRREPNTARRGLVTYDAKDPDTKFPPIEQLRPPKGAPNVLLILIDDAGSGSSSALRGPCRTPNFSEARRRTVLGTRASIRPRPPTHPRRPAQRSERRHRGHGRHHRTGDLGSRRTRRNRTPCLPLAETLKLNGDATAQSANATRCLVWRQPDRALLDDRPAPARAASSTSTASWAARRTRSPWGYTKARAQVEAETARPKRANTLNEDLADRAIAWVHQQKALAPDRPFFMYYAPGATHAPHHVPKEWGGPSTRARSIRAEGPPARRDLRAAEGARG